ncbi:MAG: TIGR03620 family F420-dependent LLM class oxidoreductase [Actinomycetota bacterium]|nr:TIGR03620 family F420-dependent LLM class oxidoreductase [Actinomycetota bacterium]
MRPWPQARDAAAEIESLGYGAIWVPEAVGREPFVNSTLLLSGTSTIKVATGIASIWGRDAMSAGAAHRTIEEAYPGRFLLGLGVSHQPMVEGVRGHVYEKPYSAMKAYLDGMDRTIYAAAAPAGPLHRALAALGPRMLRLSAERGVGSHPYFVPVEHTAYAREVLGEGPLLMPEQAVVVSTDPETARAAARSHMAIYLGLPNYTNNLRRLGWGDDDLGGGGSDALVDAIVAWGSVDAITERVKAQLDAGADHVCIQVLSTDPTHLPLLEWRELAPALLSL